MNMKKGMLHASVIAALGAMLLPTSAMAHGSMEKPLSRVYGCAQGDIENLKDEACLAASQVSGKSTFYDWSGVAQGGADSNHLAVVPDGKLCSGGNSYYDGLDLVRDDWTATPIYADAQGNFEFVFNGEPAPHQTKDWIFYVTKPNYNPLEPLKWSDLEEFCRLGNVPTDENKRYNLTCPLPERDGKHVIYNVWQRSDSPEAFYTCIDVEFVTPVAGWENLGKLVANTTLEAGDYVNFRLFDANYSDAETIRLDITAANLNPEQWAYDLANAINAQSQYAKAGVPDAQGNIVAVEGANTNSIYVAEGSQLSFKIDKKKSGEPTQKPWNTGLVYNKGDIVSHNGKLYESQWWNQGNEPGASQWGPWKEVDGGTTPTQPPVTQPPVTEPPVTQPPVTQPPVTQPPVTQPPVTQPPVTQPPVTEPPVTQPPVTDAPGLPAWDAATVYTGGDQVSYQGQGYQAKWWTQGDDPAKSGQWGVWKKL